LILGPPFRLEPGIVVQARSENVDLWPTVLELVGPPPLPDADGHSLVPQIVAAAQGEAPPEGDSVAFAQIDQRWGQLKETPRPMVAVNQGRWRLMFRAGLPKRSELYDKQEDPRERQNIADEKPDVTQQLNELAIDYLKSPPPPWGANAPIIQIDELEL